MILFATNTFIYKGRNTHVIVYAKDKKEAAKKCRKNFKEKNININPKDYGIDGEENGNKLIEEVLSDQQKTQLSKGYPVII